MAWATETLVDGYDTILYCQAAGTTATPGTANEVPYATGFSWGSEKEKTERGPWINLSTKKKTQGGANNTGEVAIDMHKATNTVRALMLSAASGTDRVKFTLLIGGTNGDKRVWDQVILDEQGEVNPAEGVTLTFPWEADSYAYTAGTYA